MTYLTRYFSIVTISLFLLYCFSILQGQEKRISVDPVVEISGKATVYEHLNNISSQTGLLFIYDSQLIDNNLVVKVRKGEYPLNRAIKIVTGINDISYELIDSYILLLRDKQKEDSSPAPVPAGRDSVIVTTGRMTDRITGEPVIYGSVNIKGSSSGIISNLNGEFRLILSDSLKSSVIRFSHLGYLTREIPVAVLAGRDIEIFMDQKIIPLQEVVVRLTDPLTAIREMMERRGENYSQTPAYITAYYREGAEYRNSLSLTEAILQIYKTGFRSSANSDQVKMLKMRNIINRFADDTIVGRIKSSIHSCLLLDIVKNPPDFLLKDQQVNYKYTFAGISFMDGKSLYQFSFEKKKEILEPLFRGDLFIDVDSYALVKAEFEIDPGFVEQVADQVIIKKSRKLDVVPEKIGYLITYKKIGDSYFQDHVKGDMRFKVRKKGKLFSSQMSLWFDMANFHTDTTGAVKFAPGERLPVRDIFSETRHNYDLGFWGNFNIIQPEKELIELLERYRTEK